MNEQPYMPWWAQRLLGFLWAMTAISALANQGWSIWQMTLAAVGVRLVIVMLVNRPTGWDL